MVVGCCRTLSIFLGIVGRVCRSLSVVDGGCRHFLALPGVVVGRGYQLY